MPRFAKIVLDVLSVVFAAIMLSGFLWLILVF